MKHCIYKEVCNREERNTSYCDTDMCTRYANIKQQAFLSDLPEKYQVPIPLIPQPEDLDAFRRLKDIKTDIYNFVKEGRNLYLYSENTGNGKTTWATKMMMHYLEVTCEYFTEKTRCKFIYVPEFICKLKDFASHPVSNKYLDDIVNAELVIWDDVATTIEGQYIQTQLLSLIGQRDLNGKANIYTSNIDIDRLGDKLDSRIVSRILRAEKIELKGGDRRNG